MRFPTLVVCAITLSVPTFAAPTSTLQPWQTASPAAAENKVAIKVKVGDKTMEFTRDQLQNIDLVAAHIAEQARTNEKIYLAPSFDKEDPKTWVQELVHQHEQTTDRVNNISAAYNEHMDNISAYISESALQSLLKVLKQANIDLDIIDNNVRKLSALKQSSGRSADSVYAVKKTKPMVEKMREINQKLDTFDLRALLVGLPLSGSTVSNPSSASSTALVSASTASILSASSSVASGLDSASAASKSDEELIAEAKTTVSKCATAFSKIKEHASAFIAKQAGALAEASDDQMVQHLEVALLAKNMMQQLTALDNRVDNLARYLDQPGSSQWSAQKKWQEAQALWEASKDLTRDLMRMRSSGRKQPVQLEKETTMTGSSVHSQSPDEEIDLEITNVLRIIVAYHKEFGDVVVGYVASLPLPTKKSKVMSPKLAQAKQNLPFLQEISKRFTSLTEETEKGSASQLSLWQKLQSAKEILADTKKLCKNLNLFTFNLPPDTTISTQIHSSTATSTPAPSSSTTIPISILTPRSSSNSVSVFSSAISSIPITPSASISASNLSTQPSATVRVHQVQTAAAAAVAQTAAAVPNKSGKELEIEAAKFLEHADRTIGMARRQITKFIQPYYTGAKGHSPEAEKITRLFKDYGERMTQIENGCKAVDKILKKRTKSKMSAAEKWAAAQKLTSEAMDIFNSIFRLVDIDGNIIPSVNVSSSKDQPAAAAALPSSNGGTVNQGLNTVRARGLEKVISDAEEIRLHIRRLIAIGLIRVAYLPPEQAAHIGRTATELSLEYTALKKRIDLNVKLSLGSKPNTTSLSFEELSKMITMITQIQERIQALNIPKEIWAKSKAFEAATISVETNAQNTESSKKEAEEIIESASKLYEQLRREIMAFSDEIVQGHYGLTEYATQTSAKLHHMSYTLADIYKRYSAVRAAVSSDSLPEAYKATAARTILQEFQQLELTLRQLVDAKPKIISHGEVIATVNNIGHSAQRMTNQLLQLSAVLAQRVRLRNTTEEQDIVKLTHETIYQLADMNKDFHDLQARLNDPEVDGKMTNAQKHEEASVLMATARKLSNQTDQVADMVEALTPLSVLYENIMNPPNEAESKEDVEDVEEEKESAPISTTLAVTSTAQISIATQSAVVQASPLSPGRGSTRAMRDLVARGWEMVHITNKIIADDHGAKPEYFRLAVRIFKDAEASMNEYFDKMENKNASENPAYLLQQAWSVAKNAEKHRAEYKVDVPDARMKKRIRNAFEVAQTVIDNFVHKAIKKCIENDLIIKYPGSRQKFLLTEDAYAKVAPLLDLKDMVESL